MIFRYAIYQITNTREIDYAFMGLRDGIKPKVLDYNLVYTGQIKEESELHALEKLFEIFNINHPKDYRGRSLSISDVIAINGATYYCDSVGWTKIEFE